MRLNVIIYKYEMQEVFHTSKDTFSNYLLESGVKPTPKGGRRAILRFAHSLA